MKFQANKKGQKPGCHTGACPAGLGWQLHENGGGDLAGAGLAVALLASSVRALPGGPARVLPWCAVVPGKGLAGGLVAFLGKDLAEDRRLLILI